MDANTDPKIVIPDTFKPVKRNRWVVLEEGKFAEWHIKFPKGEMLDLWELWLFLKGVLQIGQEEEVYRITEVGGGSAHDYSESWGRSYAERVEQILSDRGELIFFEDIQRSSASARLCYYDLEGNVTEAEVGDDLGLLLCQHRPDVDQDLNREYLGVVVSPNPIQLWGQRAFEAKREKYLDFSDEEFEEKFRFDQATLHIEIATDIWFPRVWGYLEDVERIERNEYGYSIRDEQGNIILKPEWSDITQWFDNRDLALCHTPRLNRFLQRVKQLTLDYGGQWGIDRAGCYGTSHRRWNENGILLNV